MKKLIICALLFTGAMTQIQAQETDKFRMDFDLGYAVPQSGGSGLAFYLEPKWNLEDNMSVGLRLGAAVIVKNIEFSNIESSQDAQVSTNASYVGTFDYYFDGSGSSFVPFVGAGLGYYSVASVSFDDDDFDGSSVDADGNVELDASGKFGGMIRGGFNWGKFKMSLDYNLVGKSDIQNVNGDVVGTTKNGYLGVSLGFFLGGGKWAR